MIIKKLKKTEKKEINDTIDLTINIEGNMQRTSVRLPEKYKIIVENYAYLHGSKKDVVIYALAKYFKDNPIDYESIMESDWSFNFDIPVELRNEINNRQPYEFGSMREAIIKALDEIDE